MVVLLAANGADVNARDAAGMTPIIPPRFRGRLLLSTSCSRPERSRISKMIRQNALIYAAERGNIDFVKVLIAARANPNAGKGGKTPLFAAVRQPEMMILLLSAGASRMSN